MSAAVEAVATVIDECAYPPGDPRAEMLWCALAVAERFDAGYPEWLDYRVRNTLRLALAHGASEPNDPPDTLDEIRRGMVSRMTRELLEFLDEGAPHD
jgi:hypothetical protein